MKKILLVVLFFASNAFAEQVNVKVNGLVCDFCAVALEKTFGKEEAVDNIKVSLEEGMVVVNVKDGGSVSDERIKKLVTDAGYDVQGITRE